MLAFGGDLDRLIYAMNRMAEHGRQDLRDAQRGRSPLGARAMQRMHPWDEPRTLRETRGKRVPTFRVGARDIVGAHPETLQKRIQAAIETRQWHVHYRTSREARKAGDLGALFPFGTYQLHQQHNAPVDEPPSAFDALINSPGPLLRDVMAQLEQERQARAEGREDPGAARLSPIDLREEICAVFHDEAEDICEHASECMDFSQTGAASSTGRAIAPSPRRVSHRAEAEAESETTNADTVITRHRFARPFEARPQARRIVVRRDRRRGRPRRNRHGADPPG